MAVYTKVTQQELASFVERFSIGALVHHEEIAEGIENSNFLLQTGQGRFILTLYEKRVRPEDLPWFLGLMEHLSRQGLHCPTPIPGKDGATLHQLCGRPAALTTFLAGQSTRAITTTHTAQLGTATAELHKMATSFAPTRANTMGPTQWAELLEACHNDTGPDDKDALITPQLLQELKQAMSTILGAWPAGRLPTGHIHADLFPDNVFFQDGQLSGIIDFYFACTDILAYDVAICLNAWCFSDDGRNLDKDKAQALLRGYQAVRPFSPDERACFGLLAAGAALRFLMTRLYDWSHTPPGALVTPKDPRPYLERLRFHLAQKDSSAYGL